MESLPITALKHFIDARIPTKEWPDLASIELKESQADCVLKVPAALSYFAGHFPDQAVLPGVVQVHWAAEFAKQLFALDNFQKMRGLKFNRVILPDTSVSLTLSYRQAKSSISFSYIEHSENAQTPVTFSQGNLIFDG